MKTQVYTAAAALAVLLASCASADPAKAPAAATPAPAVASAPASAPATSAPAAGAFTLTVTIDGVRSASGMVMAGLLKADGSGKAVQAGGTAAPAAVGTVTVTFAGLAPGDYAVQIFHDENGNGDIDTNAFGIPKEGYAFSNRAVGQFGPPKFDAMKVTVTADAVTQATMNY
jgi:uncharacterized protein (DUF2141 family)